MNKRTSTKTQMDNNEKYAWIKEGLLQSAHWLQEGLLQSTHWLKEFRAYAIHCGGVVEMWASIGGTEYGPPFTTRQTCKSI